jgi:hypothetical protein
MVEILSESRTIVARALGSEQRHVSRCWRCTRTRRCLLSDQRSEGVAAKAGGGGKEDRQ